MLLERLLALLTGVIVAVCLGFGLVMMAAGPAKKGVETPAPASRADVADAPTTTQESATSQQPDHAAARARVEAIIAGAPEYARFFERLRDAFPADYETAIESLSADRLAGAGEENVDYYLAEAVRLLRQSRGILAAKAEPEPLARVFDLHLEVLRAIAAQDKRLCVAFLYGGVDQEFHSFAAGRRALVADMATAGLEAIFSGQAKKIERTPPNEADFRALESALAARGLGKIEIDALLDGKSPDPPLDDQTMCKAGQTYLEVLHALPEPIRLRIYGLAVELMARS
ncbi:MAG: hypothetical protein C3F11_13650 [Methylocystaceae bacterium]|nr:MAG: hypothetical protein C3F11_13650 [Methylocystaceae bacterium]